MSIYFFINKLLNLLFQLINHFQLIASHFRPNEKLQKWRKLKVQRQTLKMAQHQRLTKERQHHRQQRMRKRVEMLKTPKTLKQRKQVQMKLKLKASILNETCV